VPVNIKGNELPQAPNYKFSAGVQYTARLGNGDMTLVPRVDLAYTGESYGSIFNGNVNRIKGYAQVNAQLQLNGADDKWYVKGFIQNVFDANSVTGLYITDQSSGELHQHLHPRTAPLRHRGGREVLKPRRQRQQKSPGLSVERPGFSFVR
jgi:outer membrane receptor protein involved in Fe transport